MGCNQTQMKRLKPLEIYKEPTPPPSPPSPPVLNYKIPCAEIDLVLRRVPIKNLDPIKPIEGHYIEDEKRTAENLKYIKDPKRLIPDQKSDIDDYRRTYTSKVLAHYSNIEINYIDFSGTLLSAFMEAYNHHEDVTLVPDDVWLTILFHFSKYVNDNAEKMRNLFVEHDGKKMLQVTTQYETDENQWEEFFKLMTEEIRKNTKDGIVDELHCNFSTTGWIEKMISTATIMDSMKKYFEYGRIIPMCGIRNVNFAGTLEDWESILARLNFLKKYDVDGKLSAYVIGLEPVILQFIDTYNGKVDSNFWDKVMNLSRGSLGSGSTTKISGWILAFYGQGGQCVDIDDVDDKYTVDVPVKLDNQITGITKNIRLRASFNGLNKTNESYRPQMSMIVCELESDNPKS